MKRLSFLFLAALLLNPNAICQSSSKTAKPQKIKAVGHAHIDPVYCWRWNEIERRELNKTFFSHF